jgi:hypothetical protein
VKYSPFKNKRPDKPAKPTGDSKGDPDTEYTFTTSASDPDGHSISYMWDWGDGNFTEGTSEESHTWTTKAKFEITVMAIDEHGGESSWSDPLIFSTPKSKEHKFQNNILIQLLLERFPILDSLLKHF